MATTTASKGIAKTKAHTSLVNADEQTGWPAMKLTILGIITLACAFAFLYFVSPMGNPP
jgi:hypothetical protein